MLTVSLIGPSVVHANDFDDFQAARSAYERHQYDDAARRLESMVGGGVPRVQDRTLVNECRELLAATYLFLNRRSESEEQFTELLRADDTYEIDSHQFPTAVVEVFQGVRARYLAEREAQRRAERERLERENQRTIQRLYLQQERMARLEALARETRIETTNSRALALLPFGVGQFRNDQRRLGVAFAVLEATLTVLSFATWGWHRWLRGEVQTVPAEDADRFNRLERAARLSNQTISATLAIVAISGVIQAQAAFVPTRVRSGTRPLPDDLPEIELEPEVAPPETPGVEAQIGIGIGNLTLRLRF